MWAGGLPWGLSGKESALPIQEMQVPSLGQEEPLEEGMATHSTTLAWRTRGQRNLEGYSPWGPKRVLQLSNNNKLS